VSWAKVPAEVKSAISVVSFGWLAAGQAIVASTRPDCRRWA